MRRCRRCLEEVVTETSNGRSFYHVNGARKKYRTLFFGRVGVVEWDDFCLRLDIALESYVCTN